MTLAPRQSSGPDALRAAIASAYRADETACVEALVARATLPAEARLRIEVAAGRLV